MSAKTIIRIICCTIRYVHVNDLHVNHATSLLINYMFSAFHFNYLSYQHELMISFHETEDYHLEYGMDYKIAIQSGLGSILPLLLYIHIVYYSFVIFN